MGKESQGPCLTYYPKTSVFCHPRLGACTLAHLVRRLLTPEGWTRVSLPHVFIIPPDL